MISPQEKDAGLLLNITGDGKGKTTSALGVVIRALGWGWKVAIWQFLKGTRETGERDYFQKFHPEVPFVSCGLGNVFANLDHASAAQKGWQQATQFLHSFDGNLLVLDELNVALGKGYLSCDDVLPVLLNRPKHLNIIVTGRYAPQPLLDASDLVSDIQNIKHPLQHGIPARKGLDF
ncbi:MAG: cob(I)yrinic acid a,c-diamide adenosyltransferase [Victivallales bacterium]|nr:cob(I)yrinic acid a,c-diamide adenosyltransferase [Victivallales bacterium]